MASSWPERISTEESLDDELSRPNAELIGSFGQLTSPLVILGAGGKMGPSLAWLAARASRESGHRLEVVAVSRFGSDPGIREWLQQRGIRTIVADLSEPADFRRLPDSENVVHLVGMKFGTSSNPGATWVANTLVPANVARRYASSRIVALSTGNVYPLVPISAGGSREADPLTPTGEYAHAAVARERIFEYFSLANQTRITLLRLNYAVDLRYGVLVDVARRIWLGEPIRLEMGYLNTIWQGDANRLVLRAFGLCSSPPTLLNITGVDLISVRQVAERLGELMQRRPRLEGDESDTALISNTDRMLELLPGPQLPLERLLEWVAHWVMIGGRSLNRPTHYETRDGKY
ncbi:MAG: NAD-dependent epimerase/dehydratase family protein [Pirellulales bacterium]